MHSLICPIPYPTEYDDWLLEWPPGRGQGLVLWLPPLPLLSFFLPQNESKRLVTLLWVCKGNELHLVTDWTGHLKPGLLALKGPAIAELIRERGVKGWLLFWKLKGRPDGNMSASVLSISLRGAYQVSISRAKKKGQTVAVNPYSATGKLQAWNKNNQWSFSRALMPITRNMLMIFRKQINFKDFLPMCTLWDRI